MSSYQPHSSRNPRSFEQHNVGSPQEGQPRLGYSQPGSPWRQQQDRSYNLPNLTADFMRFNCTDNAFQPRFHSQPRRPSTTPLPLQRSGIFERSWNYASPVRSVRGSIEFTIATYNVLSQNLIEENLSLYKHCDPEHLTWTYRRQLLISELIFYHPDIVCLQEVNLKHYETFFKPELHKKGYEGAYKQRTGGKLDGCATFYKRDKFNLLNTISIPYKTPGINVLDRDNVALLMLLGACIGQHSQETTICVANTHLIFNQSRGDIKLAQLMYLLAAIDELAYSPLQHRTHCPVILCGDFNVEPHSDLHRFISDGQMVYEGLVTSEMSGQNKGRHGHRNFPLQRDFLPRSMGITDQCRFTEIVQHRDGIDHRDRHGAHDSRQHVKRPTFNSGEVTHNSMFASVYTYLDDEITTSHSAGSAAVDYIFYSVAERTHHRTRDGKLATQVTQSGQVTLLGQLRLVKQQESSGCMPTAQLPSDHFILIAKFRLNPL